MYCWLLREFKSVLEWALLLKAMTMTYDEVGKRKKISETWYGQAQNKLGGGDGWVILSLIRLYRKLCLILFLEYQIVVYLHMSVYSTV